ncbi:MAG: AMP-dependent synthetase, partial [Caldilineaceae bacterium]|nr:AMP-dependent synthetase [Caldilineaceae bacterium]
SCFVLGNPVTPVYRGELQTRGLGMAVDVFDDDGKPVRGEVGELVCTKPWPGMTRGLWKAPERYIDAYWSRWPDVWVHGHWALIEGGQWFLRGRSDDTIKVGGKRLGPAEVEAILNKHPAVRESAAIGVPHPIKDQEVVAFCVLRAGYAPDETLRSALVDLVTTELGKPLKPRTVKFVTALPKTRNAKVMNRVIRAAYLDLPLGDLSSLEHPATVDAIRQAI